MDTTWLLNNNRLAVRKGEVNGLWKVERLRRSYRVDERGISQRKIICCRKWLVALLTLSLTFKVFVS